MGVLSDYFLATPDDLTTIEGDIPKKWPRCEAKGFGVVPFEQLGKRLKATAFEKGEPPAHGEEYEWVVMAVTETMVAALAALSDAGVKTHGAAMAKTEEVGWKEADGRAIVGELRELAKKAGKAKKRMYLWTST